MRPKLEILFKPDRAAATPSETSVQYELVIRNSGNSPARNIRLEARMFNAGVGQEREVESFYASRPNGSSKAIPAIPSRGEAKVRGVVSLPLAQVREITIQGRRLFVPVVAFNVVYEWGNGRTGQTSMSYVVGREPQQPSEKMGAFRLDLGPRLYRSVGQRQTSLARIV
jgi:hypothetical protein